MRTVASLLARDELGRVLLVSNKGRVWKFPGGVQEPGERILMTLFRELREELNISLLEIPKLMAVEKHLSQKNEETEYHIFESPLENLAGEPRLNDKDKVNFFEWVANPLEKELTPCTRAVLTRSPR